MGAVGGQALTLAEILELANKEKDEGFGWSPVISSKTTGITQKTSIKTSSSNDGSRVIETTVTVLNVTKDPAKYTTVIKETHTCTITTLSQTSTRTVVTKKTTTRTIQDEFYTSEEEETSSGEEESESDDDMMGAPKIGFGISGGIRIRQLNNDDDNKPPTLRLGQSGKGQASAAPPGIFGVNYRSSTVSSKAKEESSVTRKTSQSSQSGKTKFTTGGVRVLRPVETTRQLTETKIAVESNGGNGAKKSDKQPIAIREKPSPAEKKETKRKSPEPKKTEVPSAKPKAETKKSNAPPSPKDNTSAKKKADEKKPLESPVKKQQPYTKKKSSPVRIPAAIEKTKETKQKPKESPPKEKKSPSPKPKPKASPPKETKKEKSPVASKPKTDNKEKAASKPSVVSSRKISKAWDPEDPAYRESLVYKDTYGFTEFQIQAFREAFSVFDRDMDGQITTDDLGNMLFSLGLRPSIDELQALIRAIDLDNNGAVDFDEFLQMMKYNMSADPEQELRDVFGVFDMNEDGFITADELYEMMAKLGENITREEARMMIKEADLNGDQRVDYSEFASILHAK